MLLSAETGLPQWTAVKLPIPEESLSPVAAEDEMKPRAGCYMITSHIQLLI